MTHLNARTVRIEEIAKMTYCQKYFSRPLTYNFVKLYNMNKCKIKLSLQNQCMFKLCREPEMT